MAKPKSPAAVELGRKGGRAKWAKVTKREKARIMAAVRQTRTPKGATA